MTAEMKAKRQNKHLHLLIGATSPHVHVKVDRMLNTSADPLVPHALALFFVATAPYLVGVWPLLPHSSEYVFDDRVAVLENRVVADGITLSLDNPYEVWSWIRRLFASDFWGHSIRSPESHKSYRPLATLTYVLEIRCFGFNVAIHRLVNILLHGVATTLVYVMLRRSSKFLQHSERNYMTHFMAAAFFGIHPIHSEAVCSIVGRAELLMTTFTLLALIQYIQNGGRLTFILLSTLALLSKEQGIMICPICGTLLLLQWSFFNDKRLNIAKMKDLLSLVGFFSSAVYFRLSINNFERPNFSRIDNPIAHLPNVYAKALNHVYVWIYNAYLLVNPSSLCFDYSHRSLTLIESVLDSKCQLIFAVLTFVVYCAVKLLRDCSIGLKRKSGFLITFGLLSFLPSSGIAVTVGFVVAERVLYLPSVAFCSMVAEIFGEFYVTKSFRKNTLAALALTSTLFYWMTSRIVERSFEWNSEQALYTAGLRVFPHNAKIHYNLAKIAANRGEYDRAELSYENAISLDPNNYFALNNLALIYDRHHRRGEAETLLRNAVNVKPQFSVGWMNLGVVQMGRKKYDEAEQSLMEALRWRNGAYAADCMFNLGNLYMRMERREEARQWWRNATIVNSSHTSAWVNLLLSYEEEYDRGSGGTKALLEMMNSALEHNPRSAELCSQVGIMWTKHFHDEATTLKALKQLVKAVELEPSSDLYWMNLGVFYHRRQQFDNALYAYRRAQLINPRKRLINENMEKLLLQNRTF